jgi:hypothetical protein
MEGRRKRGTASAGAEVSDPILSVLGIELSREAREGRHLLTCETEVNGDSKRTNDRSPSLVGLLDALVSLVKYFPPVAWVACLCFSGTIL